jgi:oligogalacturonide lyase
MSAQDAVSVHVAQHHMEIRSRRGFLILLPAAVCAAATSSGKGRTVPAAIERYTDPSTDFPLARLTDPSSTSLLPAHFSRAVAHRGNFLLYASDSSERMEAYRMDLKTGQARQLTESTKLDPPSLTLLADERSFCYLDDNRLFLANVGSMASRQVYRVPEGFETSGGIGVTADGLYTALVERQNAHFRLRLIHMADGMASTLAEADEEMADPIPRPRRASVLYRRGNGVWLANFDAQQNYRLRLADGEATGATWSPDGRGVLYLNFPPDPHRLHNLREFTPDTNQDQAIADTSQFVCFERNSDASVFVGASGSKASPHVLLLVRAVRRELTLCEHRASDPRMVEPVFAPSSQRIFFTSDQHGKPAIYTMAVDRLVSETEAAP